MHRFCSFLVFSLFFLFLPFQLASSQTPEPPSGPTYVVTEGDTLWDIAIRFNVDLTSLISVNGLATSDINVGQALIIPGLEGMTGSLIFEPVLLGNTIRSLSRQYQIDPSNLYKVNRIVSPAELFYGYELILLTQVDHPPLSSPVSVSVGETMLELAVKGDTNPWTLVSINFLSNTSSTLPGDSLFLPSGKVSTSPITRSAAAFNSMSIDPMLASQGDTLQISILPTIDVSFDGYLGQNTLHFHPAGDGSQVALQGIHGMLEPGIYPLHLNAVTSEGSLFSFEQYLRVEAGDFLVETLYVDQELVDPAVTEPESEWLVEQVSKDSFEKHWQGVFELPVSSDNYCLRSLFGNRRTYNDGQLTSFHTGVDFGVCSEVYPFDIYAPASGVVIFSGEKDVRGIATILDHGWGVYSGFWHQSESFVTAGDWVSPGQLIGLIGATGRVTGPHLHWELWVNGIQVDPLAWLDQLFPHP